jgi:hypothetical protein
MDIILSEFYTQYLSFICIYQSYIQIQREKADIIISFYTDYKFDINTFDINFEPNKYLKIGIKNSYNLTNITSKLNIEYVNLVDNFFYLYFKDPNHYEEIIKIIIINLK